MEIDYNRIHYLYRDVHNNVGTIVQYGFAIDDSSGGGAWIGAIVDGKHLDDHPCADDAHQIGNRYWIHYDHYEVAEGWADYEIEAAKIPLTILDVLEKEAHNVLEQEAIQAMNAGPTEAEPLMADEEEDPFVAAGTEAVFLRSHDDTGNTDYGVALGDEDSAGWPVVVGIDGQQTWHRSYEVQIGRWQYRIVDAVEVPDDISAEMLEIAAGWAEERTDWARQQSGAIVADFDELGDD